MNTATNNIKKQALIIATALIITTPFTPSAMSKGLEASQIKSSVNLETLSKKKHTKLGLYVTAKDAHKALEKHSNILFIDVRTRSEVNFIGMAKKVHGNIPFKFLDPSYTLSKKGAYKEIKNTDFVPAVKRLIAAKSLPKNPVIFVICRSGKRSAKASSLLAKNGFSKAFSVTDGFQGDKNKNGKRAVNGWVMSNLPWSYGLKERAYKAAK